MTDTKKNTETKAATKTATKAKSTTKSKTTTKAKAKPKAETKNKTNPVDTAPYAKNDSKTGPSHVESPKQNSSAPLILLLVSAILILTTIYKYNDERSNLPAQADLQENTADAETTSAAIMQANPTSNNAGTQSVHTPYQHTPPAYEKTRKQARAEAQERATKHNEMMQQRRQAYEKEMQSKQQYKTTMEARQQERAKIQKDEFQRMKQNHLETRKKIQEMQKQIFDLHEKIRQLMHEKYTRHKP